MAKRLALALGAILLIAVGATGAYFALSIPRDVEAEKLLKEARVNLRNGNVDEARTKFQTVVQRYPRTDAAGAAITALFQMNDRDRAELQQKLANLEKARLADRARIGEVANLASRADKLATDISKRPAPQPTVARKPSAAKKPTPRKPTRRTTTRRRR